LPLPLVDIFIGLRHFLVMRHCWPFVISWLLIDAATPSLPLSEILIACQYAYYGFIPLVCATLVNIFMSRGILVTCLIMPFTIVTFASSRFTFTLFTIISPLPQSHHFRLLCTKRRLFRHYFAAMLITP